MSQWPRVDPDDSDTDEVKLHSTPVHAVGKALVCCVHHFDHLLLCELNGGRTF